jgi:hypothetical protein
MRLIITFTVLLLALTSVARAQCTLKPEESPEVRGLKLGQSYEDVKKGFPRGRYVSGISDYPNELGLRRFRVSDLSRLAPYLLDSDVTIPEGWGKRFEGVEELELRFLDDKLASIEIGYDSSTKWDDPSEFTSAISQALKLPLKGWHGRSDKAQLECSGFEVITEIILNPTLTIRTVGLDEEIQRRKVEAEKSKKKVFKP